MSALGKVAFSFIVDVDPKFAYQGWHLAHSILRHCAVLPEDIHVQVTPEVDARTRDVFSSIGCTVVTLERFGDGRYCNKLAQWDNLLGSDADHFVFLDTDMIIVADCRDDLPADKISAKVVDLANPSHEVISEILAMAGFATRPSQCDVDGADETTFLGNCNGGMYSVPRQYADQLFVAWKRWALWLLENDGPLARVGKQMHVDQIGFCLALHETGLPFALAPSNVNYFVHFASDHRYMDRSRPISILHYHNDSFSLVGSLAPQGAVTPEETAAVAIANAQIGEHFDNRLFWDLRYACFQERGSGTGSRGENLEYKRQLLRKEGAEAAKSVLDVGCGDLEVVKALSLHGYVGVDQSATSLALARQARPDWTFVPAPAKDAPQSEFVLCFEVLIHQETAEAYHSVIDYLAEKTDAVLLVSGYDARTEAITNNPMVFFHEPLSESLRRTGKFKSIKAVGAHSDVIVFRCDVREPPKRKSWVKRLFSKEQ